MRAAPQLTAALSGSNLRYRLPNGGALSLRARSRTSLASPRTTARAHGGGAPAPDANGDGRANGAPRPDYDVFVIGGGSAGVRCARAAAERGARVALAELPRAYVSSDSSGGVGGTCVLRGCVPKKLLLYAAEAGADAAAARGLGWRLDGRYSLDWGAFMEAKRRELARLSDAYSDGLARAGVDVLEGRGRVAGPNAVELDGGRSYTASNIVIATGGRSSAIPIPGAEHCILSDHVLELPRCPKKVVLVGGGYIGMEFAGMFRRLGCEVHVLTRGALPLMPRFDKEVCEFLLDEYQAAGVNMHMGCSPLEVIRDAGGGGGGDGSGALRVRVGREGGEEFEITGCDEVVLAVGRGGKAAGIGLEEAGVEFGPKGSIVVDEFSRTSVPSIWAIGDVTGRIALTPVATMEGGALARTLTGELTRPDYSSVPSAVFGLPFAASVGMTEQEAAEKCDRVEVYSHAFTPLREGRGLAPPPAAAGGPGGGAIGAAEGGGGGGALRTAVPGARAPHRGMTKVLVDAGNGRLLGVHLVGTDAPEAIQGFAVALKAGATKAHLDATVGVHPTAAEETVQLAGPPARVVGRRAGREDGEGAARRGGGEAAAAAAG